MVHLVLFELPLCPEDLLADGALLGVLRVVDLQVEPQGAQLLETLLALRALKDFVVSVNLENVTFLFSFCTSLVSKISSISDQFIAKARQLALIHTFFMNSLLACFASSC